MVDHMVRKRKGIFGRIIASQSLDLSVTTSSSAVAQVKELWERARDERELAQYRQAWHDLELPGLLPNDLPDMPNNITDELRRLRRKSMTPYGRIIVNEMSQLLAVDDIRLRGADESAPAYRVWQQNGLDSKQVPLHRGAMLHGAAYQVILPAVGRLDGKPTAIVRGKSALSMTAFFRDDFDEYPEFALEVKEQPTSDGQVDYLVTFYDDVYVHRMTCKQADGRDLQYIDNYPHGMGVCPVVRFAMIDLEGESLGEITPLIPLFRRLDQDTCDRMVVQRFGAFVVRTITSMEEPKTDEEKQAARIALGVGSFMVSPSKETKFGHIPATPMDGYISAKESDTKDLSSVSQIPSYRFLGLGDNVGADTIKAATESQNRKADEYKRVFGEAHETSLRLAGYAIGDPAIAQDFESTVHWVPRDSESLQTLTQGLASAVETLEIDPSLLWDRLPFWDRNMTEKAQELREQRKAETEEQMLLQAALGGANDADSSDDTARQGA